MITFTHSKIWSAINKLPYLIRSSEISQYTRQELNTIRAVETVHSRLCKKFDHVGLLDRSVDQAMDRIFSVDELGLWSAWIKYGSCSCDRCNPTWNSSIKRIRFRRKTRNFNNQIKRIREKRSSSSSSSSSYSKEL